MTAPTTGGFDLHLHSLHSDGLQTPFEVASRAAAAGLEGFALTDHDGVGGLADARTAAARLGLRFIAGVEISCRHGDVDLHLLGWFIDPDHPPFRRRLAAMADARERRLDAMLDALRRAGAPLTRASVARHATGEVVGRPHVAGALVDAGHATSIQDAFDRYIKRGRSGFVPLERIDAIDALALVRDAGGVAAIAHPGLDVADTVVEDLAAHGLAGLEADHPGHDRRRRAHYRALARRHGLTVTAGSDFHGRGRNHGHPGGERIDGRVLAALEARRPDPAGMTSPAGGGPAIG